MEYQKKNKLISFRQLIISRSDKEHSVYLCERVFGTPFGSNKIKSQGFSILRGSQGRVIGGPQRQWGSFFNVLSLPSQRGSQDSTVYDRVSRQDRGQPSYPPLSVMSICVWYESGYNVSIYRYRESNYLHYSSPS